MIRSEAGPFAPRFDALPAELAVFPLAGALLLPRRVLPLNIFEPRYLALVADALGAGRLMGMVQPRDPGAGGEPGAVHRVGCGGRISMFQETEDGRFEIQLTGVCRYEILEELPGRDGYRRFRVDWARFRTDLEATGEDGGDAGGDLEALLQPYLDANGLRVPWDKLRELPGTALVDFFAANLPFGADEKQALLEAVDATARRRVLEACVEMALAADVDGGSSRH